MRHVTAACLFFSEAGCDRVGAGKKTASPLREVLAFPLARPLFLAVLLAFAVGFSGCASMLDPGPAPARLQLTPTMPSAMMGKPLNKQLVVAMPLAGRDIDTDNIALIFNSREVRYLAGARWTSPAPHILQRALIDALSATNSLRGVTDETAGITADAKLLCDMRQFSLQYADAKGVPTAVLAANFRLLNLSNGSIIGTHSVNISVPANGRENVALVTACETALSRCLAEISPWVIQTLGRSR